MAAGGGVRGKGDGTARKIIIQVGATMKERHPFIEVYPPAGEMITGSVVGRGMNGTKKRVPHQEVQRSWQGWERDRHWEKQNTWGVRDLRKPQKRTQQPAKRVQPKQKSPQSRDDQLRQQKEGRDREKMEKERHDRRDEDRRDRMHDERRDKR